MKFARQIVEGVKRHEVMVALIARGQEMVKNYRSVALQQMRKQEAYGEACHAAGFADGIEALFKELDNLTENQPSETPAEAPK